MEEQDGAAIDYREPDDLDAKIVEAFPGKTVRMQLQEQAQAQTIFRRISAVSRVLLFSIHRVLMQTLLRSLLSQ